MSRSSGTTSSCRDSGSSDCSEQDKLTVELVEQDDLDNLSLLNQEHVENLEENSSSIYDQNRNLNLNQREDVSKVIDIVEEGMQPQQQQQLQDQKQQNGDRQSTLGSNRDPNSSSPVLSLTTSDGTGDSSLVAGTSNSSSQHTTDTNPTTCSTQRMSQNSLLIISSINQTRGHCNDDEEEEDALINCSTIINAGSHDDENSLHQNQHHHYSHPNGCYNEQQQPNDTVINDSKNLMLSTGTTTIDNNEETIKRSDCIMINMLNNNNRGDDMESYNLEQKSLIEQFGRRMSAIPQLLGRRKSKLTSSRNELTRFNDNDRRYSMQETFQNHLQAEPQPTTVAGVGGTITTVTRSTRKTAPLPRLVAKNGTVNLFLDNIDRRQYVRDLFTTMIDIKWRYNLMAAAFGFVFSWLFFACIWYIVLYVHNDLIHENDPNWSPCIVNVNSFSAALLFSIETQSTLGFGSRIISVECPGAIVIFCIQLIFGVVVECLIVGMVFAKLSRPAKRSQTIMYSKYATVCLRESKMCLTFRVGDVRSKSHIIGATICASLVSQKITEEGEIIPFYHYQLDVKIDDSKNNLLLIWPVTIVHLINEQSPFYKMNAERLANFKFEIITVLEGTVESTGQSIQVRSSYLPSEVKWGYRFEPIVSTHGYGRYAQTIIDYNKFNQILEVDTPNCSPEEFYSLKERDSIRYRLEEEGEQQQQPKLKLQSNQQTNMTSSLRNGAQITNNLSVF